jgi:hypothetical protein
LRVKWLLTGYRKIEENRMMIKKNRKQSGKVVTKREGKGEMV